MGMVVVAILIALGAGLVHLKDRGVLAGGGWVDPDRAERMHQVAAALAGEVMPDPPVGARMLVFGGLGYDLRVLGDPRREGFGVQSVLSSAIRSRYGRADLEVLSLPPLTASPPQVFDLVVDLVRDDPDRARVVVGEDPPRDVTGPAVEAIRRGGEPTHLRSALLQAAGESGRLPRDASSADRGGTRP
jgi:hypothetical protein